MIPENELKTNTFAIIIDIGEPLKNEIGNNFNFRLKVIDIGFNFKAKITNERLCFHKYVHLNIYTEDTAQGPFVPYIGCIIRVRRFKYKLTDRGELMGSDVAFANWLIYGGRVNDNFNHFSCKGWQKNINNKPKPFEKGRIMDLRLWFKDFIINNSIKSITWWSDWKKSADSCEAINNEHEKIDIIAKVAKINPAKRKNKCYIYLIDKEGNQFRLYSDVTEVQVGELLKLRCFRLLAGDAQRGFRELEYEKLSGCIKIPHDSYDGLQFEKKDSQNALKKRGAYFDSQHFIDNYKVPDQSTWPKSRICLTAMSKHRQ